MTAAIPGNSRYQYFEGVFIVRNVIFTVVGDENLVGGNAVSKYAPNVVELDWNIPL